MRWESLFADLEGQLEHELDAEELELRAEEERLRIGRMTLRDRLVGASQDGSEPLRLTLRDGAALELRLTAYGRDWVAGDLVGELRRPGPVVLPLAAIAALTLRPDRAAQTLAAAPGGAPPLADRLGIAFVMRTLCRRRATVELVLDDGRRHGTIDRVGRDHLDLAEHERGTSRRASAVRQISVVPFAQLLVVRI
jgi:hypothetical protein